MRAFDNSSNISREDLQTFVQQVDSFGDITKAFGEGSSLQTRQRFFQAVPMATTVLYNLAVHCIAPACEEIPVGKENEDVHTHIGHSVIAEKIQPINRKAASYASRILSMQSSLPEGKRLPVKDIVPFMETPNFWNRSSAKYYPEQLDEMLGIKNTEHFADFAYISTDKQGLDGVLNTAFGDKKYVAIIYTHPSKDNTGAHTSLLLGKVVDGKVQQNNLISIDGFDSDGYCDMTEVPYKKRVILGGHIEDRTPMLQPPSYNNMNCPLYARNFAKAVMSLDAAILEEAFKETAQEVQRSKKESKERINVSSQEPTRPVQALVHKMSDILPYYNADKSLKSTVEVARYHVGFRLQIMKRYFDSCLSAVVIPDIEPKKPAVHVPSLVIASLVLAGVGLGIGLGMGLAV